MQNEVAYEYFGDRFSVTAERKYKQVGAELTQQLQIFVAYFLDLSGCLLFAPNDTTIGRWVCRRCTVCKYCVLPAKAISCLRTVCPEVLACSATCCIIVDSNTVCNTLEQHQRVTLQPHKPNWLWFTNSNVDSSAQLAIQHLLVGRQIRLWYESHRPQDFVMCIQQSASQDATLMLSMHNADIPCQVQLLIDTTRLDTINQSNIKIFCNV